MIQQRFIELGEGYSDIYELLELMKTNKDRLFMTYLFSSADGQAEKLSFAASFLPANEDSHFMPIYICREGITLTAGKPSRRLDLFNGLAEELGKPPVRVEVKHSTQFAENDLFYQYIIGVLRLNHLLPPLQ